MNLEQMGLHLYKGRAISVYSCDVAETDFKVCVDREELHGTCSSFEKGLAAGKELVDSTTLNNAYKSQGQKWRDQYNSLDDGERTGYEQKGEILNPGMPDQAIEKRAKDASMEAFGREKWGFIRWWYDHHGGK